MKNTTTERIALRLLPVRAMVTENSSGPKMLENLSKTLQNPKRLMKNIPAVAAAPTSIEPASMR